MKTVSKRRGNPKQNRQIVQALWITFFGNLTLAGLKFAVSRLSASSALYSDAMNSISDVVYSLMIIFGMMIAIQPPDRSHPQGHSRFEPLIAVVISLSMTSAAILAFLNAVHQLQYGVEPFEIGLPLAALIASILIKGIMYLLIRKIALSVDSTTLKAAAADNLADSVTSIGAVIAIGLTRFGLMYADPIAAILVSIWIFRSVFGLITENLGFLTGAGINDAEREEIYQTAMSIPGVLDVHQIIGEHIGSKHVLDLHINVDGEMKLREVHAIESKLSAALRNADASIERVYIHVEPPEYH